MIVHTLDLQFLDTPGSIAAFAIPDVEGDGLTLVECGPYSCHEALLGALRERRLEPKNVHTVLLTHIHFDHAGAAWWWAKQGSTIHVHPRGHRHLVSPERLYTSAKQIYGDRMEELWGEMRPIEETSVIAIDDREQLRLGGRRWTAHHTPGHASHHIAWQLDQTLFTGDVGGCRIGSGPVVPPCPPPDIDPVAWHTSIARMRSLGAHQFYLTHFGPVDGVDAHLTELGDRLDRYLSWIEPYYRDGTPAATIVPLFKRYVTDELTAAGVSGADLLAYLAANPPYMSVVGLLRALKQRNGTA